MATKLRTCRNCGRVLQPNMGICEYCNTPTIPMLIRKKFFSFSTLVLVAVGSWFITMKTIELKEHMDNPPIYQFDLNYDVDKFANIRNLDDFTENNWLYKFSGAKGSIDSAVAQTISVNIVKLKEPYDSSKMELNLVRNKEKDVEVLIQLMGQFDCPKKKAGACSLTVRFDNSPIQTYEYTLAPNGRNDLIFIKNKREFIENLKKSKKLMINAPVFNNGLNKYYFNVNNLIFNFGDSE